MAAKLDLRRGPKVGDAASLYVAVLPSTTFDQQSNTTPTPHQVELYPITWVDQGRGVYSQIVPSKVWHWPLGADPRHGVAPWQAHSATQRPNPALARTAVTCRYLVACTKECAGGGAQEVVRRRWCAPCVTSTPTQPTLACKWTLIASVQKTKPKPT